MTSVIEMRLIADEAFVDILGNTSEVSNFVVFGHLRIYTLT